MRNLIKILFFTITIYIMVVFAGAYLTFIFEVDNANANIKDYYYAVWWTINATSIGDSNVYPVTIEGRIIGVVLIFLGYALFTVNVGVVSALLNHFVAKINKNA